MFEIFERLSQSLPNLTSLFVQLPFYDVNLYNKLIQQEVVNYDKTTKTFELPTNRLFFLVKTFITIDDVGFTPYKEPKTIWKKIGDYDFKKATPFPYQREGIEYGLNHDGWLLLDDCGLGKSLQMIYLAQLLHEREGLEHCLIICGVNGLKYNWAGEIAKFTDLSYRILGQRTNSRGKQVVADIDTRLEELKQPLDEFFIITNLETLQKRITPSKSKTTIGKKVDKKKLKPAFVEAFNKSKNKFDMIVLDEAHKCKDSESLAGSSLLKLKSKRNIALTGTLIVNNPENAYVPLKWTGNLNCTKTMFNKMYNVYGGFGGHQVIGYKNLDLLQEHIASCSLRRLKEEVLPQLPKKIYKTEYVELLPKQKQLYDEVEQAIAQELDLLPNKQKMTIQQEMVMNMRLRQITAYPGILSSTVTESAKLDRLEDLVKEIASQGDKVVVFGTFVSCMAEVNRRLQKYSPVYINENSTDYDIDNAKHTFETDDTRKVFIATWQKMGTGHTLTAANYVIFIDTPWTDGDFDQSADRIYRIGQIKNCIIITLVAKDTYDERVKEIIENKEALSDFIVDSKTSDKLTQLEDIIVDES